MNNIQVIIDRFEDDQAIVEIEEGLYANISRKLLGSAKEGDVINIQKDEKETKIREMKISSLMDDLFE